MGREVVGGREMYRVWGCGEHVEDGVKAKDTSALFELDMAARVAIAVWYVDSQGGSVRMSEGWRPTGIRSDADVRSASQTSMGMSTQWFQVGRMWRGETPSAIIPNADGSNASAHNRGRAWDSNAPTQRDMRLRAEGAALAGLVFNVPSESWHCEPLLPVPDSVDLGPWFTFVKGEASPGSPESTPTPNTLTEDTMTIRVQQSDGDKTFVLSGGAEWINGEEDKALAALAAGIKAQGAYPTAPVKLPADQITLISNVMRRASFAQKIYEKVNAIGNGQILFPGAGYNAFTAVVNAVRTEQGQDAIEIDEALLGKTIADSIRAEVVEALKDVDLAQGSSAADVADELAKRLAS